MKDFERALREGNVEEVRRFLQLDRSLAKRRNKEGSTPLLWASSVETARLLIAHGANVNRQNKDGYPAWFAAIDEACDLETFKVLIEHVTDQDRKATWGAVGWAAVHQAVWSLDYAVLEYLLDQGHDVNARTTVSGETPLHIAIGGDFADSDEPLLMMVLLFQRGADVNATNRDGKRPFAYLNAYIGCGDLTELATSLIDHGADITSFGSSFLLEAAKSFVPDFEAALFILEQDKVDLNSRDSQDDGGDTVAFQVIEEFANNSSYQHYGPILMSLIKHGADVNGRHRESGRTLLHYAIDGHNGDVNYDHHEYLPEVKLLLEKGSDVNAQDDEERSPLFIALAKGMWKIAELLVTHGANVNIVLEYGDKAPLSKACEKKKVRMVQLLLNAGARVDYRDQDGNTALLICVEESCVNCATLVLERGADMHAGNKNGDTPFFLACEEGNLGLIYCLMRLSPHHRRLALLSQASYPCASIATDDVSMDDDRIDGDHMNGDRMNGDRIDGDHMNGDRIDGDDDVSMDDDDDDVSMDDDDSDDDYDSE